MEIPSEFVQLCSEWYSGIDMLYAISSTGGLYRGTNRPKDEYGNYLSDEEWDIYLLEELCGDIRYVKRLITKNLSYQKTKRRIDGLKKCYEDFEEFEKWAEKEIERKNVSDSM